MTDILRTMTISLLMIIAVDSLKEYKQGGDWRKYQPSEGIECVAFRSDIDVDVDCYKIGE